MGQRCRRRYQHSHGEVLSPLMEEPETEDHTEKRTKERPWSIFREWVRTRMEKGSPTTYLHRPGRGGIGPDSKLLLSVLGCPLAPLAVVNELLPHISLKGTPFASSSAHYIVHQYVAASGCAKLQRNCCNSMYALGMVEMTVSESAVAVGKTNRSKSGGGVETGCFVLWQMSPNKWSVELVLSGSKIAAGCDGTMVWRNTPWSGTNAAKGPPRPLRRIVQGLHPISTATMFANAQCLGEKNIAGDDCFVLKVSADRALLAERSDGSAEVIRHVLYGYFSQKSGLLVYLEDSHLTRVECGTTSADTVYWESMIATRLHDYIDVDGVLVAHSGRSVATLFRFGGVSMKHHSRIRLEERWRVEDVVFNVPGLSVDTFLPPSDIISHTTNL